MGCCYLLAGGAVRIWHQRLPQFQYFANADAVFFMFDPLRVKGIRDQLHDLLPAQSYSGGDPRALLSNVQQAIGAGRPKLAVILSKFARCMRSTTWSAQSGRTSCPTPAPPASETTRRAATTATMTGNCCEEVSQLSATAAWGSIVTSVENPPAGM